MSVKLIALEFVLQQCIPGIDFDTRSILTAVCLVMRGGVSTVVHEDIDTRSMLTGVSRGGMWRVKACHSSKVAAYCHC